FSFERQPHVMIMIAQSDAEHFFGFFLLDDKTIKVGLYVARFVIELKLIRLRFGLSDRRRFRAFRLGSRAAGVLKVLANKFGQLPLKFFGRRWPGKNWSAHLHYGIHCRRSTGFLQ